MTTASIHSSSSSHSSHFRHLADVVRNNLENQQDWTQLHVHDSYDDAAGDGRSQDGPADPTPNCGNSSSDAGLIGPRHQPRILLSGLPPRRMYIHPDEQIEILKAERVLGHGRRIPQPPEYEWVLPMHLAETPSVGQLASVFDSIGALPPGAAAATEALSAGGPTNGNADDDAQWKQWRGAKRGKRILLAIVQDDSTVVYYFVHDGIVKPRQN